MSPLRSPLRVCAPLPVALLVALALLGLVTGHARAQDTVLPAGQICLPTLVPISGAASRAVNSEPSLNDDGSRAVFWSTSNPVGANADGSVEVFVADTTILSPTVPGRTVRQVTQSNGNILGGFNIMPDVTRGQVASTPPTVRTYAVFASDRDLERGKNADGGFEIFLAETEPQFRIWQLTNTRQSASILPTVSEVLGGSRLRIAFVSENGPGVAGELPRGEDADRNYEIYVMTVTLTGARPSVESVRQVTRTPAGVTNDQPAISPDGGSVVWLSNAFQGLHPNSSFAPDNGTAATANAEVFVATVPVNLNTPITYRQVTRTGTNAVNDTPDLSRNASRIVFSSTALNPGNAASTLSTPSVFVSSAATASAPYTHNRVSAPIKAPPGRTITAKEPSISADGRRIAFAADGCDPDRVGTCGQPQGLFQLFVADQGNSASAQYSLAQVTTDLSRTSETPSISGDGSFIALVQTSGGAAANPDLSGSEVVFLDCPVARLEPQKTFSVPTGSLAPNLPDVGDTVQYSVTLVNRSLANFENTMIITDVLPAQGLSNIVASVGPRPDGTTVSPPNLNLVDGIATWSVTNLPKGGRATVYIQGVVQPGQGGQTITNQVFITTTAKEVETGLIIIDPFAEVSFDVTQVNLSASLTLQKNIVREGETFEIRLNVSNSGTGARNPATNVQVVTDLPSRGDLEYLAHAPASDSYNAFNGLWTIPRIDPGQTATLVISVRARPNTGGKATFSVGITSMTSQQEDAQPSNNLVAGAVRKSLRVIGTDMRLISKSVSPSSPPQNARVTYAIVVRNNGPLSPDALYNANKALFIPNTVVITDVLPAGLSFVSASTGGVAVGNTVVWKIPGWGDGPATTGDFTRTVTVTAQVLAVAGTQITNRVEGVQAAFTAAGVPLMNDPLPANNTPANITATFRVNSPAEATVTLRSSSASITEGTRITATLVYTDQDPLDTHNVRLVWGDGAPAEVLNNIVRTQPITGPLNLTKVLTFTHVYADDPPTGPDIFTITAHVTDSNGLASAPASTVIQVNNVLPQPGVATVAGAALQPQPGKYVQVLSRPLTITLPFSDPGFQAFPGASPETIRYRVDWGDGNMIPLTNVPGVTNGGVAGQTINPTTGQVRVSHAFGSTGAFQIRIFLSDDDGSSPIPALTVPVTVTQQPIGVNDFLNVLEDSVTAVNVLANDVQGAPLSLQSLNTTGTLGGVAFTPGGVVTYTANVFDYLKQGEVAYTSFTYLARDTFNFTATAQVSVTINGVSDPPLVDLNGPAPGVTTQVAFVEDQPAVTLASALTITDPDSTHLSAAAVTLLNPLDGAQEALLVTLSGGITGTYVSTTGVLSLTGAAPLNDYRTVLRTIAYTNTSDTPDITPRAIQFLAYDETATPSAPVTATVTVQPTDDPPVVITTPGNTAANEGQPVQIDAGVVVTDVDSPLFDGGALTVTIQSADNKDELTILAGNGITVAGTTAVWYQGLQIGTIQGWQSANLRVALNANASQPAVEALARQVAYRRSNRGNPPNARTATFRVRSSAIGQPSNTATKVIAVTAINDPPEITLTPATALEETTTSIRASIAFTDPDALNGNLLLTISVNYGTLVWGGTPDTDASPNRVVTTGTLAALAPGATTLSYTGNTDFFGLDTLSVSVNDQGNTPPPAQSASASTVITVTNINDAPTLGNGPFNAAFTEGGPAVAIAPTITVNDVDSANIFSATVRFTAGFQAGQDVLAATTFGGISANYNSGTGVLTLSGVASLADYQNTLRTVTYNNTSQNPNTANRALSIVVADDPDRAVSAPAVSTVTVTPVNNAPTLTPLVFTRAYVENGLAVTLFPTITVADVDNTQLFSATARFTSGFVTGEDVLAATTVGGISASYNPTTGVLSLTGVASLADYQNTIRSIAYSNSSDTPATNNRTVTVDVADNGPPRLVSAPASSTFTVTAANDAPRFTPQAFNVTFTEDAGPVFLNPALVVQDPDSAFIFSATVRVATNYIVGQDVLAATPAGPISVSFAPATGTLTLSGIATPADYTAVLQSVTYNNSADFYPQTTRSILYTAWDEPERAASTPAVASLTIIPVNDPPTINLANTPLSVAENAAATRIDPAATVTDPDSTTFNGAVLTVSIAAATVDDELEVLTGATCGVTRGGSTYSHTGQTFATITGGARGTGLLVFTLDADANFTRVNALLQCLTYRRDKGPDVGSRVVTISLREFGQTLFGSASRTINITGVNDAPEIFIAPVIAATEQVPQPIATSILITDVDAAAGTIIFTASVNSGVLQANVANGIGLAPVGSQSGATIVVQGTEASIRAWLQTANNLVYTYDSDVAGGTVTLTVRVNDQGNTPAPAQITTATRNLTLTYINDPPVVVLLPITAFEDQVAAIAASIRITDVDVGSTPMVLTATVSSGVLTATTAGGVTLTGPAAGAQVVLNGTQAQLRTMLATNNNLRFALPPNASGSVTLTVRLDDRGGSPPPAQITQAQQVFVVTPVNDAPTLSPLNATLTYTENATLAIAPTLVVADIDSADLFTATARIVSGFVAGQDVLTATVLPGGISAAYNAGAGVLTLSNVASLANYQAALNSVTYRNTSDNPSTTSRVIHIVVADNPDRAASAPAIRTLNIVAVNDAPTLSPLVFNATYVENSLAISIAPTITVADVDSTNLFSATARFTAGYVAGQDVLSATVPGGMTAVWNGGSGVLTLTGPAPVASFQTAVQAIRYGNTSENPNTANRTIQIVVADDPARLASAAATSTVAVVAVDDPPALTANLGMTVTHPATGTLPLTVTVPPASLTASDVDSADNQINYAIVSLPVTGTITLEVSPGVFVARTTCATPATGFFTQADVQAGRLRYVLNSTQRPFDALLGLVVQNGVACPGAPQATYTVRVRAP